MALRDAGLVTSRKDGLRVYYRLSDPQLVAVLNDVQRVALARDGGMRSRSSSGFHLRAGATVRSVRTTDERIALCLSFSKPP